MDWESPKPPKPEESIAERLRARRGEERLEKV